MLLAIEVWSNDYARIESTCRYAESIGIDAFYYGESPHDLNLECWTTLAALARATKRIRLGPVITNVLPSYRSTHLLARQAAAVSAVSNGRLDFRTGVGAAIRFGRPWWQPFGVDYPNYETRLAETDAALETMIRTWSDTADAPLAAPIVVPVTVAATGERAMAMAVTHGDGWETSFATPAEFAERSATMDQLLAGRPIMRSLEIDGFVASNQQRLDRLLTTVRRDRGENEELEPIMERALVGTPAQAADQLGTLAAAGVDQVLVAAHDPHDHDVLDALVEARAQL